MDKYLNQKDAQQLDVDLMNTHAFSIDQLMELAGTLTLHALMSTHPLSFIQATHTHTQSNTQTHKHTQTHKNTHMHSRASWKIIEYRDWKLICGNYVKSELIRLRIERCLCFCDGVSLEWKAKHSQASYCLRSRQCMSFFPFSPLSWEESQAHNCKVKEVNVECRMVVTD